MGQHYIETAAMAEVGPRYGASVEEAVRARLWLGVLGQARRGVRHVMTMRLLAQRVNALLMLFGLDPRRTIASSRGFPRYFRDLRNVKRQLRENGSDFSLGRLWPCLNDWDSDSGTAKGHYFYQDLLVAHRVYLNHPRVHVDVGSRVDGFVAHVASFRPIQIIDIRPLHSNIPNVECVQADFMAPLPGELVNYCDSVSCLHALEHFGLGRYGDRVNINGDALGLGNLHTILEPRGKLYLSVPIGRQRIEFNAHRVYSVDHVMRLLDSTFHLDRFSFVDDRGELHDDVQVTDAVARTSFGCCYGCGIFEMTKR